MATFRQRREKWWFARIQWRDEYKQKQEILERCEAKFPDDYKRLTDDSQGRKLKDTILENEKKIIKNHENHHFL